MELVDWSGILAVILMAIAFFCARTVAPQVAREPYTASRVHAHADTGGSRNVGRAADPHARPVHERRSCRVAREAAARA